jgi:hypothetical protein
MVLHGYEQNKNHFTMYLTESLTDIRLKLDCVNNVMQCTVHTTKRPGCVTRLPLKTSTQYRKFLDNFTVFNPLNAELNPIRHLLALAGARHFVNVSRIRVNNLFTTCQTCVGRQVISMHNILLQTLKHQSFFELS